LVLTIIFQNKPFGGGGAHMEGTWTCGLFLEDLGFLWWRSSAVELSVGGLP